MDKLIQPNWICIKDRLPDKDGFYFAITESKKDFPIGPKGTIHIDTMTKYRDGQWEDYLKDDNWQVIYWADIIPFEIPKELENRKRLN